MSSFWSRILVAAVALPLVLGLVWLGGWWLFALVAVAAVLALHELFWMTRTLRPVVLAGYVGALACLLGAHLAGLDWAAGGFFLTLAVAFVFKGVGGTRQATVISVSITVFGAAWVGFGLAHALLLREIPDHGRLAAFTVLLTVWASETAAYFAGLVFGRHKLAPTISPGKTWEGFVAGSAAAIFTAWISLYETGFVDGWRSLVLGGVIALASPLGDLFESALKRDMNVKDAGRLLAGHGGMLDRLDALLFSTVAAYYVIAAFGQAS
ncbi:MAG TPA: phosphatidate cytidylyltransferase [Gaiellaceae bacterium]|jgi:phosphatidate cytidylyltransferase|nr:phosphatidate cytidylyltransferase [Gaiellaceae bacterium]